MTNKDLASALETELEIVTTEPVATEPVATAPVAMEPTDEKLHVLTERALRGVPFELTERALRGVPIELVQQALSPVASLEHALNPLSKFETTRRFEDAIAKFESMRRFEEAINPLAKFERALRFEDAIASFDSVRQLGIDPLAKFGVDIFTNTALARFTEAQLGPMGLFDKLGELVNPSAKFREWCASIDAVVDDASEETEADEVEDGALVSLRGVERTSEAEPLSVSERSYIYCPACETTRSFSKLEAASTLDGLLIVAHELPLCIECMRRAAEDPTYPERVIKRLRKEDSKMSVLRGGGSGDGVAAARGIYESCRGATATATVASNQGAALVQSPPETIAALAMSR